MLPRAGLLQRFVMWAMWHTSSDSPWPRSAMDVERSRAWAGALQLRITKRLGRDLDRPVRVLAARDLAKARVQGWRSAIPSAPTSGGVSTRAPPSTSVLGLASPT